MRRRNRVVVFLATAFAAVVLMASSCEGTPTTPAREEASQEQRKTLERVRENQKVEGGNYSPTLNTIQRWIDTWMYEEGKVSYIYFADSQGTELGYYVLDGLPVSYCTSGSPPYDFERRDGGTEHVDKMVPAPSMDAVWYSGGECNRYYAFEAETGTFLDWTSGMGISTFVRDQPIRGLNLEPYVGGETTVEDVPE